ncbi:hypothetical protein MRQ36_04940 [Micromonospora sp. R77]|uniref:hypothetical protein n=1 Tax=Micromonospora sp. R77 TaxID=2925836 RepID=UPI001F6208EB|nr:hypothetical protein [Micromonospora sp. R77]MCI4061945.1 hypothetical protein [Micromonospora sp. R77]
MVTRWLAELLLRTAVRRWPAELRADLHREWVAELHVLAARRDRLRMLRFAASLALSRSGGPIVDRPRVPGQARRTAATLLAAPLAGVAALLVAAVAMNLVTNQLLASTSWAMDAQVPVLMTVTVVLAVLLARATGRAAGRTALPGPLRVALGVVAPLALTAVGIEYASNDTVDDLLRAAPGLVVWLPGLFLVLWGAGTLAGRGRTRVAWCLGLLGALVVADLAVVLVVVAHIPAGPETVLDGVAQGDTVDRISAPLWLFATWTDSSLGLPRPTGQEVFLITDLTEVQPFLYLAWTPYALAYAIGAGRAAARPADEADPVPAPA